MTPAEILSLAYQLKAAGDARPLAAIVAEVRADAAALFEPAPPAPGTVTGGHRKVNPDGSTEVYELLAPDNSPRLLETIPAPPPATGD